MSIMTSEQLTKYVNTIVDTQSIGVDGISGATVDCQSIGFALNFAFNK